MSFIAGFGSYLPSKIVNNAQLAEMLGCTPEWIKDASGIEERRYAADDETVDVLAANAGRNCLEQSGVAPDQVDMLIVSSGSGELRFPGPASAVAKRLNLRDVPALDLPIASAGALFGMSIASRLTAQYANILVIAAEKMSSVVMQELVDKNTAILFGDGAGSCLIRRDSGDLEIVDSVLHSDGSFVNDLQLGYGRPLQMNGRSVIMQATRKIPAVIVELLQRNHKTPAQIERFIMHQANQNLIDRAAKTLDVPNDRFYSNIRNYGNTSSASMLIAAHEWWKDQGAAATGSICFVVFGAGFHWGALLAQSVTPR